MLVNLHSRRKVGSSWGEGKICSSKMDVNFLVSVRSKSSPAIFDSPFRTKTACKHNTKLRRSDSDQVNVLLGRLSDWLEIKGVFVTSRNRIANCMQAEKL